MGFDLAILAGRQDSVGVVGVPGQPGLGDVFCVFFWGGRGWLLQAPCHSRVVISRLNAWRQAGLF